MRIVSDSSSDLYTFEGIDYKYVSLKIRVDGREFVDNEQLDINEMMTALE
ncbi:MAG: DegV family protein, partial [Erysipelotrichaceae bacterium]|nr:DegV family protein [Erysipelotrichaceae bacterium]